MLAIVPKAWVLPVDPDGYCYSGPPSDTTPPTPAVIVVEDVDDTGFTVRVIVPSVDAQFGVLDYRIFVAPVAALSDVEVITISIAEAINGRRVGSRASSTAYRVYVKSADAAPTPNISDASNSVDVTTTAAVIVASAFPNWPIMRLLNTQGDALQNLLNDTQRPLCAESDVWMFPWFYPTNGRLTSRAAALADVAENSPGCKKIMYTEFFEGNKNNPDPPQNNPLEIIKNLIDGPNGHENWYLHTNTGERTECRFSPTTQWQHNGAVLVAGRNSSGKRFDEAYWPVLWAAFNAGSPANFANTYLDGIFIDNYEAKSPTLTTTNGTVNVTSRADMNADGTIDVRGNYTAGQINAGGLFWAQGSLAVLATAQSVIGPTRVVYVNGARLTYDYFDGSGSNPPPLPQHPMYGKLELPMKETVSNDFDLRPNNTTQTYAFGGQGGADLAFRRFTMQEKFLKPDNQCVLGRGCAPLEARCVNRATPDSSDYDYARFILVGALLMPRSGFSVNVAALRAMPLDELIIYLGNPLADRFMGTLNEATSPPGWTMRQPDFINGSKGRFYWARFQYGIAVANLASPTIGTWPTSDTAVSCTLPANRPGKKWQFPNASAGPSGYKSPAIYKGKGGAMVSRSMRGQNTTLNSGLDTTTVLLKPYQGAIILEVDA